MKHIKIEVKDLGEGWGKVLRIVEQTHRGHNFKGSTKGVYNNNSYCFEGFALISITGIAVDNHALYVRGKNKNSDDVIVLVPSEEWLQRLRSTVKKYNKEFRMNEDGDKCEIEIIE